MTLRAIMGEIALDMAERADGQFDSGSVANAGMAVTVLYVVHVQAFNGLSLDVSLEESSDNENWVPIAGSAMPPLMAVGNYVGGAMVEKNYVRVSSYSSCGGDQSITYGVTVHLLTAG